MPTLSENLNYQPAELNFGTSGLRGLVTDMTDLECYINTAGFLKFLEQTRQAGQGKTIYLAGDLRDSTPRILRAVAQAITDNGYDVNYCGLVPTPAIAFYALEQGSPCIMVTGSHIPADRNGIKFYKADGEVLKSDEAAIKAAVAEARAENYAVDSETSAFNGSGMLKNPAKLPDENPVARETYLARHTSVFADHPLKGKKIVFYQHSAVGRDILVDLLKDLGAGVIPVGRSDIFVPIDSENVTPRDQAYFRELAQGNPDAFAIVSTDGDSDRPFVVDETGTFHRGDVLGAVVAKWLQADNAAFPVTCSDAATDYLSSNNVTWQYTKVGSPYVVVAMQEALASGSSRTVGWEVNGGFMLGSDLEVKAGMLRALPTRDAILPIIVALVAAIEANQSVSGLFSTLPQRYTQAGLIDNFPNPTSKGIIERFSVDTPEARADLGRYFSKENGFGDITQINSLDGVRIFFENGEIAHLRPSGNAPQLRIYSVADTQARADEIVQLAIAEPDGIFRKIEENITKT